MNHWRRCLRVIFSDLRTQGSGAREPEQVAAKSVRNPKTNVTCLVAASQTSNCIEILNLGVGSHERLRWRRTTHELNIPLLFNQSLATWLPPVMDCSSPLFPASLNVLQKNFQECALHKGVVRRYYNDSGGHL